MKSVCFLYGFPIVAITEREWVSTPRKEVAKSKPGRLAFGRLKFVTRNCQIQQCFLHAS